MRGDMIDNVLVDALWGTSTRYLGVYSLNQIPSTFTNFPCAYVANTDPSTLPGRHWVAFYHLSPSHLEFFDSYGFEPDDYHFPLSPHITEIDYNSHPIQSLNSSDCGQYCIFYVYQRSHSVPMSEIIKSLSMSSNPDRFVRTFSTQLRSRIRPCSSHCCSNHQCCTMKQKQ